MASTSPFTLKWGVMATGGIAKMFVKDFLTDPAVREVSDVRHQLVAVASSTSKQRADEFVEAVAPPEGSPAVNTYGSYAELVADAGADIIYVATPHSHHFQNAMLALEAGKHVLCEKALTVNAAQTRKLVETARAKKLFFMEAVWTRYFPLSIKVRELVKSGAIGEVHRVFADFSFNCDGGDGKLNLDAGHRLVNPDLAGGALLDLGIYSLTWCFQILYHLQEGEKEKPKVTAAIQKYSSGVDENTTIVLSFPKHRMTGVATTSMRVNTGADKVNSAAPTVRIQGTQGEIQILGLTCRPTAYKVIKRGEGTNPGAVETVECPIPRDQNRPTHNPAIPGFGHGMYWEADECARCLRDGRTESATLPLDESIVIMEVMEEALRQGEVTYPELITTDVFDAKSPLNTGNA